jgi:hypothetical protein
MIGPDHIIAPYKQDHIVVSMSDVFSHKSHFHRTCCQHRAVSTPVNIINQHTYIVGAYAEERLGLFNVERARSILEFDLGAKRERYRVFLRPWQHETKEESWKESGGILPCYTRMFTAISVLRYRFGISIKQAKTREKHRFYWQFLQVDPSCISLDYCYHACYTSFDSLWYDDYLVYMRWHVEDFIWFNTRFAKYLRRGWIVDLRFLDKESQKALLRSGWRCVLMIIYMLGNISTQCQAERSSAFVENAHTRWVVIQR